VQRQQLKMTDMNKKLKRPDLTTLLRRQERSLREAKETGRMSRSRNVPNARIPIQSRIDHKYLKRHHDAQKQSLNRQ